MNPLATPEDTCRSPLISAAGPATYGDGLLLSQPHTDAELATLLGLLTGPKPRIETVAIGHSRDDASRTAAQAFAAAWTARGGRRSPSSTGRRRPPPGCGRRPG